jgi:DNA-binding XRE family transcriptional regulator
MNLRRENIMDKVKIGKFISKCRKDKQLTQEQLAEMLNVTNYNGGS